MQGWDKSTRIISCVTYCKGKGKSSSCIWGRIQLQFKVVRYINVFLEPLWQCGCVLSLLLCCVACWSLIPDAWYWSCTFHGSPFMDPPPWISLPILILMQLHLLHQDVTTSITTLCNRLVTQSRNIWQHIQSSPSASLVSLKICYSQL